MTWRNRRAVVGAHHLRRTHPDVLDRLHAGPGVVDDRKGRHEGDQQHRRHIAEPEPEQEQRRIGEARNRRADADQRHENIFGPSRAAHDHADCDADQRRNGKADQQADERIEHVMRQNSHQRQAHERRSDGFQRRKQPRREQAEMRDDFPKAADHDEGKRIARSDAPARFLCARFPDRNIGNGADDILCRHPNGLMEMGSRQAQDSVKACQFQPGKNIRNAAHDSPSDRRRLMGAARSRVPDAKRTQ